MAMSDQAVVEKMAKVIAEVTRNYIHDVVRPLTTHRRARGAATAEIFGRLAGADRNICPAILRPSWLAVALQHQDHDKPGTSRPHGRWPRKKDVAREMTLAEIADRHEAALRRAIQLSEEHLGRPLATAEIILIAKAIGAT